MNDPDKAIEEAVVGKSLLDINARESFANEMPQQKKTASDVDAATNLQEAVNSFDTAADVGVPLVSVPLVSVIMPAYNSAPYIKESIESVLAQTYPNIELIVLNDGSNDQTQEIIDSYGDRVISVKAEHKGVSAARNTEIGMATGEWIAFCDSDDVWFPSKLEQQLQNIGDYNWCYTDSFYIGETYDGSDKRSDLSEMVEGNVFESLLTENVITTSSILIRRSLLLKIGLFDETLHALEDWMLWLAIAKNHPIKYIPIPLLNYRVHTGSASRKAREMLPIHFYVIDAILSDLDQKQRAMIKSKAIEKSCISCSYIAEQARDMRFSFKCACLAFKNGRSLVSLKRVIATFAKLIASGFAGESRAKL